MIAKSLLTASLALMAATSGARAQDVGVAAAVQPNANAQSEAGTARIVEMGQHVIFNDVFSTDANGIVQIQLADGSNFTVGPSAVLKIDKFVYNPEADTATLAASASRGMFRFIGGAASKRDGEVEVATPVGVAGIRGAIVDFNLNPLDTDLGSDIPIHISLLYGEAVTLTLPDGRRVVLTLPGTSIIFQNGQPFIVWTPHSWSELQDRIITNGLRGPLSGPMQALEVALGESDLDHLPLPPPSGQGQGTNVGDDLPDLIGDVGDEAREDTSEVNLPERVVDEPVAPVDPEGPGGPVLPPDPPGPVDPPDPTDPPDPVDPSVPTGPILPPDPVDPQLPPDPTERPDPPVTRTYSGNYLGFSSGVTIGGGYPATGRANLNFDAAAGTMSGTLSLWNWGDANFTVTEAQSHYTTDSDFGGQNATGHVTVAADPSRLCDCEFLTWGTWAASGSTNMPSFDDGATDGFWIAGDPTLDRDMPLSGSATYSGRAIGMVTQNGDLREASGAMTAGVDFATGMGNVQISDFDGRDFGTDEFAMGPAAGAVGGFRGEIRGEGGALNGDLQGMFVNDGAIGAGGIIGGFDVQNPTDDWAATGIFGGALNGP